MSEFRIATCMLGMVSTNCYLVYDNHTKDAVIIDPADNAPFILNKCRELGIKPGAVLLTHGHFDHIMAVKDICRAFPVKIYASRQEDAMLADPRLNLTNMFEDRQMSFHGDVLIEDGEELSFLDRVWKVIATPGHTSGSVCFYLETEQVLFAGDTLFQESMGRTDLPTGSSAQLIDSILNRLLILPDDVTVYPGHGDPTTIGYEKKRNPVVYYRG